MNINTPNHHGPTTTTSKSSPQNSQKPRTEVYKILRNLASSITGRRPGKVSRKGGRCKPRRVARTSYQHQLFDKCPTNIPKDISKYCIIILSSPEQNMMHADYPIQREEYDGIAKLPVSGTQLHTLHMSLPVKRKDITSVSSSFKSIIAEKQLFSSGQTDK